MIPKSKGEWSMLAFLLKHSNKRTWDKKKPSYLFKPPSSFWKWIPLSRYAFKRKAVLWTLPSSNLVFPAAGDPRGDRTAREKRRPTFDWFTNSPPSEAFLTLILPAPILAPMDYVVKSSKQGIWPIHSSSLPYEWVSLLMNYPPHAIDSPTFCAFTLSFVDSEDSGKVLT